MKSLFQKSLTSIFSLLIICMPFLLEAQAPVLLKDININTDGAPEVMLTIGNTVFFSAVDPVLGRELWKSDGTLAGTVLVKDIAVGASSSSPTGFCNLNGTLFFAATGAEGRELWKSDGTSNGTVLVANINPNAGSNPAGLFAMGTTLFFKANNGQTGEELWKSNGTALGTKLVKDINPQAGGSQILSFISLNNTLFFTANDGTHGRELWKTNGLPDGTVQVKDINLNGNSDPVDLVVFNNQLFFSAATVVNGVFDRELWKTTGTELSTVRVKDINTNGASMANTLTVFNNALYFNANAALYKTDGTEAGTTIVPIIDSATGEIGVGPNSLTVANNTLFFFTLGQPALGQELWKLTPNGVASIVADIRPGPLGSEPRMLTAVGTLLMFTADDGIHGRELWKTNGTAAGTVMVQDLVIGMESSGVNQINGYRAVRGSDLFFSSFGPGGLELRRSNGALNGVVHLRDIGPTGSDPSEFTRMGNLTYFTANDGKTGRELWKTDGTLAGTQRVADIIPDTAGSNPQNLKVITSANGAQTLFFVAKDPLKGRELFKLENQPNAVPTRISDILAGPLNSNIGNLTNVNGTLFFTASKTVLNGSDFRVFKVNTARTGVDTVGGEMSFANNLVAKGSTLFFTQKPTNQIRTLCKLENGSTTVIKEFGGAQNLGNLIIGQLLVVENTLFFTVSNPLVSRELWKQEITPNAVPIRIFEIIANGANAEISNMTNFQGVLHFTALIAGNKQIYKTNAARTEAFPTGGEMKQADNLTVAGSKLFFTQSPANEAPQLWKLENGISTLLFTFEILKDGQSAIPKNLTAAGGKVFFTASDAVNGRELWQSDGTTAGTIRISDIKSGVGDANILEIRLAGQDLFLSANNQTHGQEPWRLANVVLIQGGGGEARNAIQKEVEVELATMVPQIKVYPNPTSNFVKIDLPQNELTGTLSIVSASGQLVRSVQSSEGEASIQLDVQDLPKGVYLVRWVQSDDQIVVKKLIVQ